MKVKAKFHTILRPNPTKVEFSPDWDNINFFDMQIAYGMCITVIYLYHHYFSHQWLVGEEEKKHESCEFSTKIILSTLQTLLEFFSRLLQEILSSSHFKCSKVIAILIKDKE